MSGQLGHQPVGDRPDAVVFLGLIRRRLRTGDHARAVIVGSRRDRRLVCWIGLDIGLRVDRTLVLGTDIAAFDPQAARAVDADEGASARDLLGVEDLRAIVELVERRLDLAEPLIDFLWQLVGLGVGLLQTVHLGLQRIARRLLLAGERTLLAAQLPQAVGVAIGELGRDIDPLPALGADRLGLLAQLLDHQHVEETGILQPAAVVALEEIAQDHAAGLDVGVEPDELRALVRCPHGALGEHPADDMRLLGVGLAQAA